MVGCFVQFVCSWVLWYAQGWVVADYLQYVQFLVLYSMNRSRLAIYRVGGVGDMRHLK